MYLLTVKQAVDFAGGAARAGAVCGVSTRAIYKWISSGCLPRTEYTGETCYAEKLAKASCGAFSAAELLEKASPSHASRLSASTKAG